MRSRRARALRKVHRVCSVAAMLSGARNHLGFAPRPSKRAFYVTAAGRACSQPDGGDTMQPSTRRPRSSWRTVRTLIGLAGLAAVPWLTGCDRAHHESQPEAPTFGRAGALAIQDLGTLPDGRASGATGVNARGQVVGTSATASGVHAFLWDGAMHDLGTLGGTNSFGTALNAQGQVGGWSETPSSGCRPFLWDRGAMQDLGGLGGDLVTPGACPGAFGSIVLNARGQAAGIGATASGAQHAFLWDGRAMLDLGSGYSGDRRGRRNSRSRGPASPYRPTGTRAEHPRRWRRSPQPDRAR